MSSKEVQIFSLKQQVKHLQEGMRMCEHTKIGLKKLDIYHKNHPLGTSKGYSEDGRVFFTEISSGLLELVLNYDDYPEEEHMEDLLDECLPLYDDPTYADPPIVNSIVDKLPEFQRMHCNSINYLSDRRRLICKEDVCGVLEVACCWLKTHRVITALIQMW